MFQPARRHQAKGRICLDGPSGSGKTWGALAMAGELGTRIAVIDTEHGSASKYAGDPFTFDVMELGSFHPDRYIEGIREAGKAGYDVLIIDSLSHAWTGKDGALELKDRASARPGENSFTAWRTVSPLFANLIDEILRSKMHVIATLRTKMEYVLEPNDQGKMVPRKVGTKPVMRDGIEYEFDVVGDLDIDHNLVISKTRCRLLDGKVFRNPADMGEILSAWLSGGEPIRYATDEQVGQIVVLMADLYGTNGKAEKAVAKMHGSYGVQATQELTVEQAADAIQRLGEALAREKGDEVIA